VPAINHAVADTLIAVAEPYAAKVLVPVVPVPVKYMVSLLAMSTVVALGPATNVIAVPIG
jgi:flavoprotein